MNIFPIWWNSAPVAATLPATLYDLFYSLEVVQHTPHPKAALRMLSFLVPGRTLKLVVFCCYSWKTLSVLMSHGCGVFWNLDRIIRQHSEAQEGFPVTYVYTKRQLRTLAEGVKCRVQELFVDHIFPWRILDYVQYRFEKVWHFRVLPRSVFRWLETHFGWHSCVTAVKP